MTDSGFPFPEPYVGGDFAEPLSSDPKKLAKQVQERFDRLQRNQDALGLEFPLSAALLQSGALTHAVAASLTLTDSEQDVPSTSITLKLAGTYVFLAIFNFVVSGSGVGICVGAVNRGGSNLARLATFAPASTGEATVAQFNVASAQKGDVVKLRAYKSSAGGSAEAFGSHTQLLALGPIGPVS
jgi:hypothetical protein